MPGFRDNSRRLRGFARVMRHEGTDAERRMWKLLRDRKLAGFKFRRQHPVAGYVADFFCAAGRLVVEVDGGQHGDPGQVNYDRRKTEKLNELGIRVMRFSARDVMVEGEVVLGAIYEALVCGGGPSPRPSPGVPGEGDRRD